MGLEDLRVGIIGCGALGQVHAKRFAGIPGVMVAALADPVANSAQATASALSRRPGPLATDYREILDCDLDLVCIASPDSLHVPQLLDALAAGLHVLCEKPLTLELDDLEAVLASRDEVGKHVALTYPRRYDAGIRAIRREIQSGRYGTLTLATLCNAEDWITPNVGTWRHDPALCPGGFLYDANGHQLDTLFWCSALEPEWVRAGIDNRGTLVPIVSWGEAGLGGGAPVLFAFPGDGHAWREQLAFHCEGAEFLVQNGRAYITEGGQVRPLEPDAPEETADEAIVKLIRGDGVNWAPPEDVRPIISFTQAALESAASGQTRIACKSRTPNA